MILLIVRAALRRRHSMAANPISLVRGYLSGAGDGQLETIAESAVAPICQLIESSCEIADADGYAESRGHIESIVSQRMEQSRLARRAEHMDDDALRQVFQEICSEATREVSFAMLCRGIIRPISDDRLADELRVKSMLVSCEYSRLGWMWVERILTPEIRVRIPQEYFHAVRHELYYICVAEAVRLHRLLEINKFNYRLFHRTLDKVRDGAQKIIADGRVPQLRTVMGKSRPIFRPWSEE